LAHRVERVALSAALFLFALGWQMDDARRPARAEDPLPSWNEGEAKRSVLAFVRAVTDRKAGTFVEEDDRIATFDNDGTLWVEHPMYTELQFAIDRVHALAEAHPEWKTKPPFSTVLSGDRAALAKLTEHDAAALIAATHSGMTPEQFKRTAADWLATAEHPRFGRRYLDLTYQPMLELLGYLRANGFRTFLVSGGGVDFMRAIPEEIYGVPPSQVVGSSGKTEFEVRSGKADLKKLPEVSSVDDGKGKPININLQVGQRPIFTAGNSDGDLQMLQYTTGGGRLPRLGLLVHHDDAQREYAYDRDTSVGRLDKALKQAPGNGWIVVSMARDWNQIFPNTPTPVAKKPKPAQGAAKTTRATR
jgi:hypothetical protein